MRAAALLSIAAILAGGSAEAADAAPAPVAMGPQAAPNPGALQAPSPPDRKASDRHALVVLLRVDGGVTFIPGVPPGAYARFGAETLFAPRPRGPSLVYGFSNTFEGWGTSRGSGFSFPVLALGGFRASVFVATLGAGVNVVTVDGLDGTMGGGLFSPRASARVGFDFGPVHLAAEANVQYRWQWKLDDRPLFQAGVSLGPVLQRDPLR
jgi:hypothetical protein